MAKAAFAFWNNRIAPVFDVARSIHLVETKEGRIIDQKKLCLTNDMTNLKVAVLAEQGIDTLVCGAISKPLQGMISAYGIQVIPFVAGGLEDIIKAWICGILTVSDAYAMPGYRKNRRCQRRHSPNTKIGESNMDGRKGVKVNASQRVGAVGGQDSKGRRRGRGSRSDRRVGFYKESTQNVCICPACGYLEPHQCGVPCASKKCPTCNTIMTRQ
jgi:predicted Fe-Mo cluster-binding NifX family protein